MLLAGRAHRQHALGKATACLALRAETALAPAHGRAQRSLGGVVWSARPPRAPERKRTITCAFGVSLRHTNV